MRETLDLRPILMAGGVRLEPLAEAHRAGLARAADHPQIWTHMPIAALGATREGVFRVHMVRRDGSLRDSVYFSVVRGEWPAVRERLAARLGAVGAAAGA